MTILYNKKAAKRSVPDYMLPNVINLAPDLEPVGDGNINVAASFPWTFTPGNPTNESTKGREETPVIILEEFYQKQSSLQQQLRPYGLNLDGATDTASSLIQLANLELNSDIETLYENIFDLRSPTGFTYTFPLFTQENYTLSNSWEKKDLLNTLIDYQKKLMGPGGAVLDRGLGYFMSKAAGKEMSTGVLESFIGQIPEMIRDITLLQLQNSNPAVGLFDPPQIFRSSAQRQYRVAFYLYNTNTTDNTDEDIKKTIIKNWELCYMLSYQNSVNKNNFFTGLPPVFYKVLIPGVHFSKASVISNLSISNVGNIRRLELPIDGGPDTDVNVPDAYMIDITLQDVFMPSKNIHAAVVDTEAEKVITTD